jgi:hypothetical protein
VTINAVEVLLAEPGVKLMSRHPHISADTLLEHARHVVDHLVELSHSSASDTLLEISAAEGQYGLAAGEAVRASRRPQRAGMAFRDVPDDLAMLRLAGRRGRGRGRGRQPRRSRRGRRVSAGNDDAGVAWVVDRVFADHATAARSATHGISPAAASSLPAPYWAVMDSDPRPFEMDTVVSEVEQRLAAYGDLIEVAVLGSAVNGIGEARHSDFGITAAKDTGIIYAKGHPLKKVPTERLVDELFTQIDQYYAAGKKVVVDDTQAADAARWLTENEDDTTR